MDKGFAIECEFFGCTFNPFVVGSTPAGPTNNLNEIKGLQTCKPFFLPDILKCNIGEAVDVLSVTSFSHFLFSYTSAIQWRS